MYIVPGPALGLGEMLVIKSGIVTAHIALQLCD